MFNGRTKIECRGLPPARSIALKGIDTAFGEQVLDVAIAEREPEVELGSMLDDGGRKVMAGVEDLAHPD